MSKREIIFLAVVALAVVVFLADQLMPSSRASDEQAQQRIAQTESFVDEQNQLLQEAGLEPHETIMLDMLIKELPVNPFARQWVDIIAEQKRMGSLSSIAPVLSYNGYIRCGDRFVALINEEEYEVGNKINDLPLIIRSISPEKIDVENPNTISQSQLSIKILSLETDDE
jgi:hypothetical protein